MMSSVPLPWGWFPSVMASDPVSIDVSWSLGSGVLMLLMRRWPGLLSPMMRSPLCVTSVWPRFRGSVMISAEATEVRITRLSAVVNLVCRDIVYLSGQSWIYGFNQWPELGVLIVFCSGDCTLGKCCGQGFYGILRVEFSGVLRWVGWGVWGFGWGNLN